MSSVHAVTEDMLIAIKIASFYPLSSDAQQDIVKAVAAVMEEMRRKHNFIVWRVSLESKGEK